MLSLRFGLSRLQTAAHSRHSIREFAKKATAASHLKHSAGNADTESISDFDITKFADRMEKCVEKLRLDLGQMRLGRANTSLLENVKIPSASAVDHSHSQHHSGGGHHHHQHHRHHDIAKPQFTKLSQLAQLIVKDPQTVHIIVADSDVRNIYGANSIRI
jgi:hypothetical protein